MNDKKTKILCILDGFGLAPASANNCISLARMPNFKRLLAQYHWTTLNADGDCVGQESGLVGNSEVGHMNIGGLKMVPQLSYQVTHSALKSFDLNKTITPDQLFDPKEALKSKFESGEKIIHLIGLFSKGQIHSDLRHWAGSIQAAGQAGAEKIVLHIISDGRDSDRQSLVETWDYFVENFGQQIQAYENKIYLGSLGGRFYAMDRDKNWGRVAKGLGAILNIKLENQVYKKYGQVNNSFFEIKDLLREITVSSYSDDNFDEHICPQYFTDCIEKTQTVWLLNFRTDRMKQFAQMLCDINQEFTLNLNILAMNNYGIGKELFDLDADPNSGYFPIFNNEPVQKTLAQRISGKGKTQLHIAETEKYNHVTYFLNGGQNKKWPGEDWVVIDSNKVTSHAEKPEMKAKEVTDYILQKGIGKYDYIVVNYANPDMVGHTGDIHAGTKSMDYLDIQLGRLVTAVEEGGHSMLVTADHGNIEFVGSYAYRGKKLIDTEHNSNPVPLIFVSSDFDKNEFLSNLKKLCEKEFISYNMEKLNQAIQSDNQIDLLGDKKSWLEACDIPTPLLPLWYSGLFFVGLG